MTLLTRRLLPLEMLLALWCVATPAFAELPSIRFDRMAPLGAAAGGSVEVEILGAEIDDVKTLFFDRPGFTVEFVKERFFKISVADTVPAGTYDVRLVGRFGISNPRLFAVSRGLAEVHEKEPNNDLAQAQPVSVNSAINGSSDGNGEDDFRFPATKGQRLTIRCYAQKLDSSMDATLTVSAAAGNLVASNSDTYGSDPFIDFVAPADGEYVVSVSDLSFRGGFPYRLVVTDRPQIENVVPRAMQVGKPTELTFFGRNFGPGSKPSSLTLGDLPLLELRSTLTASTELTAQGQYRFFDHPTDHSVLPTAATCTLFGWQVRPNELPDALDPPAVLATENAVSLESEPNDDREKPQAVTIPAVVSGRFDAPRDADWYEFESGDGGNFGFEVYSERIGGHADPYLVVMDDKGNRVNELDDFGHRMNAFDGHLRDPSGSIGLQPKKKYRVLVQDRYQRGGPRFQYVLAIQRPTPDFTVSLMHHQNPGPGGTTVFRGGAQFFDVIVNQRDGFSGPITITAENLPNGLHGAPTTVFNTNRGNFVLWADADAEPWTGTIRMSAVGQRDGVELRREARSYSRVNSETSYNSSRPSREVAVAIRETAPFALQFTTERIEAEPGKPLSLPIQLTRNWPDFKEKATIQALALPGGFSLPNAEIAAGQTQAAMTLTVPNGARPGEYTIAVLGQGQVPFSKDPMAATRPNTLVSLPSRPLTIVVKTPPK